MCRSEQFWREISLAAVPLNRNSTARIATSQQRPLGTRASFLPTLTQVQRLPRFPSHIFPPPPSPPFPPPRPLALDSLPFQLDSSPLVHPSLPLSLYADSQTHKLDPRSQNSIPDVAIGIGTEMDLGLAPGLEIEIEIEIATGTVIGPHTSCPDDA